MSYSSSQDMASIWLNVALVSNGIREQLGYGLQEYAGTVTLAHYVVIATPN
jgi:hypothetical protein